MDFVNNLKVPSLRLSNFSVIFYSVLQFIHSIVTEIYAFLTIFLSLDVFTIPLNSILLYSLNKIILSIFFIISIF